MNDTKLKEIEEQLETIYDELTIFKGRYIDEDNEGQHRRSTQRHSTGNRRCKLF